MPVEPSIKEGVSVYPKSIPLIREDLLKALALKDSEGFLEFIKYLQVRKKTGGLVTLTKENLYPEQHEFNKHRTGKDIVVKARQLGITTFECLRDLYFALSHPNSKVLIAGHTEDIAKLALGTIRDAYERFADTWGKRLKLEDKFPALSTSKMGKSKVRNQQTKLTFANGSQITVKTAGKDATSAANLGRGDKADRVHLTEVAFWACASEAFVSLNGAIHRNTEIVIESTPTHVGTEFHKLVVNNSSGNDENEYAVHFYPWFNHPEYQEPNFNEEENAKSKKPLTPETDDEKMLVKDYGISLSQLAWYRNKVTNSSNPSGQRIEYPYSLETAFAGSDYLFLPSDKRTILAAKISEPIATYSLTPELVLDIYEQPISGVPYVLGADVAAGVGGDNSAIVILNSISGEIAAVGASCRVAPSDFTKALVQASNHYNGARITVEEAQDGASVISRLFDMNFASRLFWIESGFATQNGGFRTTGKSKPIVFGYLRECLFEGWQKRFDKSLYHELSAMRIADDGRVTTVGKSKKGREKGENAIRDDRVFAYCLALWTRKMYPSTSVQVGNGGANNWGFQSIKKRDGAEGGAGIY